MDADESHWVTTFEDLAAIYKRPTERLIKKELNYVDAVGRALRKISIDY